MSREINCRYRCRLLAGLLALGFSTGTCLAQPHTAVERSRSDKSLVEKTSLPASFTVTGCVKDGTFTSGRFSYQVRSYVNGQWQPAALGRYEGKTVRIDGMLAPGDRLGASTFVIVDEKCRLDLHGSKFN